MKNSRTLSGSARSMSASEISRSLNLFDIWCIHQGCEQAAYADLPTEFQVEIDQIFNFERKLPYSWISQDFSHGLGSEFTAFIRETFDAAPRMFSSEANGEVHCDALGDIHCVFTAWSLLQRLRTSDEKWSEADFVAKVYNVLRSPAVRKSSYRSQCAISLPHPLHKPSTDEAERVLRPKVVVPDAAIFICPASVRLLSHSKSSPWKVLNRHPSVQKQSVRKASSASSFRQQTTPRTALPESQCFEFISSIWEDKKPSCELLVEAYRQNRMATTSVLRHLHAMYIKAPIVGLVWSSGTVRAHVDWYGQGKEDRIIYSAPFPGGHASKSNGPIFHEWQLDKPCDIIQVFLLIRNIDTWTEGEFRKRVNEGITDLLRSITELDRPFHSWKHRGSSPNKKRKIQDKENLSLNSESPSPVRNPLKVKSCAGI